MDKLSPLASVAQTREVLEAYGLATKKALGQHFLINDGVVSRICALAEVEPSDVICEIGPGIGTLTLGLLRKGAKVVSIERDGDLREVLAATTAGYEGSFVLISRDALEVTEPDVREALACANLSNSGFASLLVDEPPFRGALSYPNKLVANLPYAVAATLVLDYFERFSSLQSATVMVQREVADRMAAQPGSKAYGAYTVKLRLHAQVRGRFSVGPQNFFPPPRIESAVLRLDRSVLLDADGTPVPPPVLRAAAMMADAAFANRRKTILNSCKTYFASQGGTTEAVLLAAVLEEAGISPDTRGEALSVEDYLSLGRRFIAHTNA